MSRKKYRCARCANDVRPANFGNDRKCAFSIGGLFEPENWNCATLDRLMEVGAPTHVYGDDETLSVIMADPDDQGFLVLTRYKTRGCTSGLSWVGDFPEYRAVTKDLVERAIRWHTVMRERRVRGVHES